MSNMHSVKLIAEKIKNKKKEGSPKTKNLVAKNSQAKSGAGKMANRNKDVEKGSTRKKKHKHSYMEDSSITEAKVIDTIMFHDIMMGQKSHDVMKMKKMGKTTVAILKNYGNVYFVVAVGNGQKLDGNKVYDNPYCSSTASSGIRNVTKMYNAALDAVSNGSTDTVDIVNAGMDGIGARR